MAGLGWLGLVFPEQYEGSGMSFLDLAVLLEETGRACLPGPFFSTVVLGGLTILDAGTDEQKQTYLPKIARGEAVVTMALTEADGQYGAKSVNVRAEADGDDYVITGAKLFVPDAHVADHILCVARTGRRRTPRKASPCSSWTRASRASPARSWPPWPETSSAKSFSTESECPATAYWAMPGRGGRWYAGRSNGQRRPSAARWSAQCRRRSS